MQGNIKSTSTGTYKDKLIV